MDNLLNDLSSILPSFPPHLPPSQTATCFISSSGLKVTVEQAKCVQANAFIQAAMFQHYSYQDPATAVFCINLNALIVGTSTKILIIQISKFLFRTV